MFLSLCVVFSVCMTCISEPDCEEQAVVLMDWLDSGLLPVQFPSKPRVGKVR